MKERIPKNKSLAKMPQLVVPIHAFDEKNTKILHDNQRVILEHLIEFSKLALSIKKDMRKIIDEEITKQFDDKELMLMALYKRNIVIQNRFIKKGLITREEIGDEYEELKKELDKLEEIKKGKEK